MFVSRNDFEGVQFLINILKFNVNFRIETEDRSSFALTRATTPEMFRFLISYNANPDLIIFYRPTSQYFSLLHMAICNNFAWMVKELLAVGVDPNVEDCRGTRAHFITDPEVLNRFK